MPPLQEAAPRITSSSIDGASDRQGFSLTRPSSDDSTNIVSLQRELTKTRIERDKAIQISREWQMRVSAVKAELDKERGSIDRLVAVQGSEREKEIRRELQAELAKSEAGWKERMRNERLLRLSYERVLINLGFAPNRIASDLVCVSRPQPLTQSPEEYKTMNLVEIDEVVRSQTQSKRKGLFSYGLEEIKAGISVPALSQNQILPTGTNDSEWSIRPSRVGRRELLKSLALSTVPH
jgi:hypothetical protein